MPFRFRVALLGFSAFERETFASFFRLAAKREPAYDCITTMQDADFVIADADRIEVASEIRRARLANRTLFIGGRPVASALGATVSQLPRPINPMAILKRLDSMALNKGSALGQARAQGLNTQPGPLDDATD